MLKRSVFDRVWQYVRRFFNIRPTDGTDSPLPSRAPEDPKVDVAPIEPAAAATNAEQSEAARSDGRSSLGHDAGSQSFSVAITSRRPAANVGGGDKVFWEQAAGRVLTETEVAQLHAKFVGRFGDALFRQARELRRAKLAPYEGEVRPPEPNATFSFAVHELRYGSLLFSVEILGLASLVSYLLDSPELVLALIETCIPDAFAYSTGLPEPLERLVFDPQTPPALREAILAAADSGSGATSTKAVAGKEVAAETLRELFTKTRHIPWFVPTLLALVVLAVAFSGVTMERDRIQKWEAALGAREKALLDANLARTVALESLTMELVNQLREVTPATQPCCARCCQPRTPVRACAPAAVSKPQPGCVQQAASAASAAASQSRP